MLNNKIIHQTWKIDTIPEKYAAFVDSIKRNNPDYDYRLWTDRDNRQLIQDQYPWFLSTYDSYTHGIERVDAVRYFILYTYGGVYIDLDMECLRSIDNLFQTGELFFSLEAGPLISNKVVSNAFMAADQGHPFFHYIMTHLDSFRTQDITFSDVFKNTGPDMVTQQLLRQRQKFDVRVIGLRHICPKKMLSQHPDFQKFTLDEIRKQKRLYLIHHNTESWNIQVKWPEFDIEEYQLYKFYDINGFDIDYVEYTDDKYDQILAKCNQNPDAIGFNYNGYIKGFGGKLEKIEGRSFWSKTGVDPWICIKKDKLYLIL
ncbi:MAG: glycosyltransferase [Cyanobacteria bacterium P01_B01_bin.77]